MGKRLLWVMVLFGGVGLLIGRVIAWAPEAWRERWLGPTRQEDRKPATVAVTVAAATRVEGGPAAVTQERPVAVAMATAAPRGAGSTSPRIPATGEGPEPTVTLTVQPPRPTGTPLPFRIVGPLAIDGPRSRLYARVEVHGVGKIGVFSADDGSRLGTLDLDGGVAVDPKRGRLLVDDPATGLHVLDAETGVEQKRVEVPQQAPQAAPNVHAIADERGLDSLPRVPPAVVEPSGRVAIARNGTLWIVDVDDGRARSVGLPSGPDEHMLTLADIKSSAPGEPLWILARSFGVGYGTRVCVHRLTDLEAPEAEEVYRWDFSDARSSLAVWPGGAAVMVGGLFGDARWELLGRGQGRRSIGMYPGELTWLQGRDQLVVHAPSPAGDLLIVNPRDLTVVGSLPQRFGGHLAGYDRTADRLFATTESQVQVIAYSDASRPQASSTPAGSDVSDRVTGDRLLPPESLLAPDLYNQAPGKGGVKCRTSPVYATDHTAFCGAHWRGLYRTTDGGRSFQTAMSGLTSWAIDDLVLSPSFARDRILFVTVDPMDSAADIPGTLYRSSDGGTQWMSVGTQSALTFAPDFATSRRMYAFGFGGVGGTDADQAYRSDDAGLTWRAVGRLPDEGAAVRKLYAIEDRLAGKQALLAIGATSLFKPVTYGSHWPNQDPRIYRSVDGGRTWTTVLARSGLLWGTDVLRQVNSAAGRPVILLQGWEERGPLDGTVTPDTEQGEEADVRHRLAKSSTLRSYDLGGTWEWLDDFEGELTVDEAGNAFGSDPDKEAIAPYTLPSATPSLMATREP